MKIGDIVQLKSGGPLMTVVSISSDDMVDCGWFTCDEYESRRFNIYALERLT